MADDAASLATAKGIAQTLGQMVTGVQRQGFTVGTIIAVNNIGNAALSQVLANPNPAIFWVVFHNPSDTIELLVGPSSIGAFSFSSRGGAFVLPPGDFLPLVGNVSFAWSAIAASSTNNPLTIITSTQ